MVLNSIYKHFLLLIMYFLHPQSSTSMGLGFFTWKCYHMFIPKGCRAFITLPGLCCWNFPLTSIVGYSTAYTIFFTLYILLLIFTVENHYNSSWYPGSMHSNNTVSPFWSYWLKEGWVQSASGRDSLSFQLMECCSAVCQKDYFIWRQSF